MNGFLLKRHSDGKYVTWPGQEKSYTKDVTKAQNK